MLHFFLDQLTLLRQLLQLLLLLGDLGAFFQDLLVTLLGSLCILFLALLLLLQVVRKFDQVVLNEDVLLTELLLAHACTILLLFEILFLVLERLLDLVHEAALL
mgnify:CR=1 FL=1